MLPSMLGSCTSSGSAVGATVAAALQFFAASQCLIQEPWPTQIHVPDGSYFDFIIVGGGTAGSTLAARLSELQDFTVLLIEAGGDPPQESIVPAFRGTLIASPYDWNFTTVDDHVSSQSLRGGEQFQPRGKMLGGTGSLNDMVYARGFPEDYYEWAEVLGETWNWTNVLEYFKKTEHCTDDRIVNDEELMRFHGRDGEIEVTGAKQVSLAINKFLDAFQELGFNIVKDMTYPNLIGAGRFSHTIRNGNRDSSLTALLNKAKRDNLYVLKHTQVTNIVIEKETAIGIIALSDNKELRMHARKEVIISAGTFNTPKLLLLSGIGPKDHLEELGIELVKDLPVGDNLHDHAMVITYMAAENGTCDSDQAASYMDIIRYLYDRSGTLSLSDSMGAYIVKDSSNVPEFAIYPTCLPKNSEFFTVCMSFLRFEEDICRKLQEELWERELLSFAVVLLKPKSRGKVRIKSTNFSDEPLIHSGTFSHPEDLEGYPEAMKVAWSIGNTSYFIENNAYIVDIPINGCNGLEGDDLIKCRVKSMVMSAWHSVGTAAMGSVVDAELKVIGVKGLRVIDASVMLKIVRGNTNAPVVMIAEKGADFIKKDHMN